MRILLLRPLSPNDRFGLGPFFRVEPLGLEYVAASLIAQGHEVQIVDRRFAARLERLLARFQPELVGLACTHAVDIPAVLADARTVKRWGAATRVVVGGHSASVFPAPFTSEFVDAVCVDDGEFALAELITALGRGETIASLSGWLDPRQPNLGCHERGGRRSLDGVGLPARHLVEPYRRHYLCVHKQPIWAVETARGCPFRCTFCSTWRRYERSFRLRGVDLVCRDMAEVGANVFVVDDLFFHPRERSLELARELRRRGIRKDWLLVQTRLDTVARHPELLEAWRPLARHFDLFFGFEAASDEQLSLMSKDASVADTEQAVKEARRFGFGVTGNFVIDPEWDEADFEALWAMVDRLDLRRLGYTILTPLPGTPLYATMADRIRDHDFSHYDMHHLLTEPKLGRRRFFELFVECWRRNVLSTRYATRKWWRWLSELNPRQALVLGQVLWRTQRMLKVESYLAETFPMQLPALPPGAGPIATGTPGRRPLAAPQPLAPTSATPGEEGTPC